VIPAGVTFLDHTADVGMDVEAPSLPELLHRSALGMLALLRGEEEGESEPAWADAPPPAPPAPDSRPDRGVPLDLCADAPAGLLAAWLRELLFLHEVQRRDYARADFHEVRDAHLIARVHSTPGGHAVREIKGITYHQLVAERVGEGWRARVIFDV
jgi:SHS2 domain-containing protein